MTGGRSSRCTVSGDGGLHSVLWKPPDSQKSCSSSTVQFAEVPGPTDEACCLTHLKHAVALELSLQQQSAHASQHCESAYGERAAGTTGAQASHHRWYSAWKQSVLPPPWC